MYLPLILLVAAALISIIIVCVRLRMRAAIPPVLRLTIEKEWVHVRSLPTPEARVLEADKVLDHVMAELGATGSFADKLRRLGPRLRHSQPLWDAHKLRNRIAHETGLKLNSQEADRAVNSFEQALREFLR